MASAVEVLYVEDCEITVELLKRSIKRHYPECNILLHVVGSVSESIKVYDKRRHVAALIDWNLPDGEGSDVAKHIRALHSTLTIIFLSSVFTDENLRVAGLYNPGDCLVKDFSEEFVTRIIRNIL